MTPLSEAQFRLVTTLLRTEIHHRHGIRTPLWRSRYQYARTCTVIRVHRVQLMNVEQCQLMTANPGWSQFIMFGQYSPQRVSY